MKKNCIKLLELVLNQKLNVTKIIAVDDCSKDRSKFYRIINIKLII